MTRTAIADRTLLTVGNVEYVGVIHHDDSGANNPLTDWYHGASFVPFTGGRWERELFGDAAYPSTLEMEGYVPAAMIEAIDEAEYGNVEEYTEAYLAALRRLDPSGVYVAFRYVDSNHGPGTASAGIVADDEGNGIAFMHSDTIRTDWNVKRITARLREQVVEVIAGTLKTFVSWCNGEVYGWELLRQEHDEDGECLSSESLDSCWGYVGDSEWEHMYGEAQASAEADAAERRREFSSALAAMDQFAFAAIA